MKKIGVNGTEYEECCMLDCMIALEQHLNASVYVGIHHGECSAKIGWITDSGPSMWGALWNAVRQVSANDIAWTVEESEESK